MIRFYNTLSRKKEKLAPIKRGAIKFFACGPTVYDEPHLGHGRTYITFDMIVNFLRYNGYDVTYLQNITDIDDKIIRRAEEQNAEVTDISRHWESEYHRIEKKLKIKSVTKYARATDYIPEIINQILHLEKNNFTYATHGNVYFNVNAFPRYGMLSHQKTKNLRKAVRIEEDPYKKNFLDFALWKTHKEGEPFWQSPWGEGRPGWHIEDTAITEKEFGPQYDIHGGGGDLLFPHHESEIAQMEGASGLSPMVRCWLHTGLINVNNEKMSKSLKNFITMKDVLSIFGTDTFRFWIAQHHYRSPINYEPEALSHAQNALAKIQEFLNNLSAVKIEKASGDTMAGRTISSFKKKILEHLENDFNTPRAIAEIFSFMKQMNARLTQGTLTAKRAADILDFFKELDTIFIFFFSAVQEEEIPKKVTELLEQRKKAREEKIWGDSDRLRDEIKSLGYTVEDTIDGQRIKKDA